MLSPLSTTSENGRAAMAPFVVVALSLLYIMTGDAPMRLSSGGIGETSLVSSLVERHLEGCTENPVVYEVTVDIQSKKGSGAACSATEEGAIGSAVVNALNSKFKSKVADWDGEVTFGPIAFDASQVVKKRRALQVESRRLEETCPLRGVPCELDYCRWGCLEATSTDCGVSSLTNWAGLEDDVKAALVALNYACLGPKDQIVVNLVVIDPNQGYGDQQRTIGGDAFVNQLLSFAGSELDDSKTNEATAPDLTGCKDLEVNAQMRFDFFAGTGAMPLAEEVATLVSDTQTFLKEQVEGSEGFSGNVCAVILTHVVPTYNANSNPDLLEISFVANTWVKQEAAVEPADALHAIAGADFKGYIGQYLRAEEGNEMAEVFKVHFKGSASVGGEPAE